ncbi:putative uncharacterized protein DANCR [Gorilla gorilla gorilla]|uniref:putative uncharacterized protein DANCR n=1 Tax=Gorilla gorilla gorilla TaxID=9595 RepID=UPI002445B6CF|nr:putative uncharacterized protein DANCR [Gorilla gorilla gorilla]
MAYPSATARATPRPAPDTDSQWPGPSRPIRDWLCVPRPSTPPRSGSSRDWLSSPTSPGIGCAPRPCPESSRDWLRAPRPSCFPHRPAPPRAASLVCAPGAGRRPLCQLELRGLTRHYFVAGFGRATRAATGTQPQPTLSSRSSSLTSAEVQLPQFLAQVDNYRHKPLKLECPVGGISIDLSQLSLQLH